MRINVTNKWLKSLDPCVDGYQYWIEVNKPNIFEFIKQCKKDDHLNWANWLIVRCMTRKQYLAYSIYAAEQVIHIFEKEYPDDKKPREAIESAKKVLRRDTQANKKATYADAAYTAAATAAAYTAAAYAANVADAAANADANANANADAFNDMQWKLLKYGIKLMKEQL